MHSKLSIPLYLAASLLAFHTSVKAFPSLDTASIDLRSSISSLFPSWRSTHEKRATVPSNFDTNPNGSTFVWLIKDTYAGETFFDRWDFFTGPDPTDGTVNFVNQSVATANELAYVEADGTVVMKGDNTTWLAAGENRDSVRISTQAQYETGLFILDLNHAPWGCGVWPAFWTMGNYGQNWPYAGEIDILEGVHDNEHNQVTWHTGPGCNYTADATYTGAMVQTNGQNNTQCNGLLSGNAGCGVIEWSRASYGPFFDSQGGGVFAMKWDENGIAIWSFYRAAIPQDIVQGNPNPSNWGAPVAQLLPDNCDIGTYFYNHSVIFDITFCGDWAGNSYATSGCPGSCLDRVMDPSNFVNASWSINSLKVYSKTTLSAAVSSDTEQTILLGLSRWTFYLCLLTGIAAQVL